MKHFIANDGLPATVKLVPLVKVEHFGNLQRVWDMAVSMEKKGLHKIVSINVASFTQASVYVEKTNTSPWAGFWICTNYNPQQWIQLSKSDTECGAVERYNSGKFDKVKGVYKGEAWTQERIDNAIKLNEYEQVKHYGKTNLDFIDSLPDHYKSLVSKD